MQALGCPHRAEGFFKTLKDSSDCCFIRIAEAFYGSLSEICEGLPVAIDNVLDVRKVLLSNLLYR